MDKLIGALSAVGRLDATLSGVQSLTATLSLPQVVEIANKKATADITIAPVPQNYGLITWDGSTLTVS